MSPKNKRNILLVGLFVLICVIGFFIFFKKEKDTVDPNLGVYSHTTPSGKKIVVQDTHPKNQKENSVIITTEGFENNTPFALKKGKLTDVYFVDLNNDNEDEVVLVFASLATSHTEAVIYTTFDKVDLSPIEIPAITEEETAPGEIFEGYLGGDTFSVESNKFFRTFLVETKEEDSPIATLTEESAETAVQDSADGDIVSSDSRSEEAISQATTSATSTKSGSEGLPPSQRKTITYNLTTSEGIFLLEPQIIEITKQLTASTTAALPSTTWKWVSLNNKGVLTTPSADDQLILSFTEDGTFNASTTCEVFAGGYITNENLLRLGSLINIYHEEGKVCSSQVSTFKNLLPEVEAFVIRENQLMITLSENGGVILFTRQ